MQQLLRSWSKPRYFSALTMLQVENLQNTCNVKGMLCLPGNGDVPIYSLFLHEVLNETS